MKEVRQVERELLNKDRLVLSWKGTSFRQSQRDTVAFIGREKEGDRASLIERMIMF